MAQENRVCRQFTLTSNATFYDLFNDFLRPLGVQWASVAGLIISAPSTNSASVTIHDASKDANSPGAELIQTFIYSEQSSLNNIMTTGLYLKSADNSQKINVSARRS